ncbi:alpha/beta hydrolase [Cytobacillus oceanisediminis]|uniref:alpha/beta hydrolase n=1 Tax=Cytobacillus oceanisediminis TaxID=665099 RepID=UPI002040D14A|nr:alpha/beta hydrolase [Cytobacillus oceanisediminis]MCM3393092.1 alpha/beta hydrolase [Cytobacillus oceanisediminis]
MVNKSKIYYGEHESQFGVLRMPENSNSCPVIVLIHGGFWQARYNLEENNPIADDLTHKGYATWNIEYRRVGEEGGGWSGTFNDVINAVNHLLKLYESYPIDLSRVVVIGHSAGGHLALWLASRIKSTTNDSSFNYYEYAVEKGENVKLIILPDIDHFKIIEPTSSAWISVLDSL